MSIDKKYHSSGKFRRPNIGLGALIGALTERGRHEKREDDRSIIPTVSKFHGYAHNGLGEIIRLLTTKTKTLLDPNRQED